MPRYSQLLPSVTPVIAFLDVDSFECQIWQREDPSTRGRPCVVANSSGRIVAVTHEAKALGVSRDETPNLRDAVKKCGNLVVFRKPDKFGKQDQTKCRLATWELVSNIQAFLKEFSGGDVVLEVASSDEFYLDISSEVSRAIEAKLERGSGDIGGFNIPPSVVWERVKEKKTGPFFYQSPNHVHKDHLGMIENNTEAHHHNNEQRFMFGALFMNQLISYLEYRTDLQMSGGVAKNKLLAKVGCTLNKPRRLTILHEQGLRRVAKNVKISSIPGLGGTVGETLKEKFQVSMMGDIFRVPYEMLEQTFGKEKAGQITSWALGQDTELVVHKISKDQMKCAKPSGDIKTYKRLTQCVTDLTSEIQVLFLEEETRYGRRANLLRVEYKFQRGNMESQQFDIESSTLQNLHLRVLNYFDTLPELSKQSVHLTHLAFVLKQFIPINGPGDSLVNGLSSILGVLDISKNCMPPASLRIQANVSSTQKLPEFDHKCVGGFRITQNMQYSTCNVDVPKLLPDSKLQSLVGKYLLRDFQPHISCLRLIKDYDSYTEVKHEFFSKWLQKEKPSLRDLDDVKFVTFHGRLLRALKTPLNLTHGEWEIYAINVNNIIYLWDEKSLRTRNTFYPTTNYMGELFEQMVSGRDPPNAEVIDSYEKVLPVQKLTFGGHKLLILSNIDAQDDTEGFVQVQLRTEVDSIKYKRVSHITEVKTRLWSQSIVSGCKNIVIGDKNGENILTKVERLDVDELLPPEEDKDKCFHFLNRLLDWINEHLSVHDENVVKKFSWVPGKTTVICSTIQEKEIKNLIVPRLYFKK